MVEEIKKEEQKPEKAEIKKEEKEKKKKEKQVVDIILHLKPAKLLVLLLQDKQWHTSGLARETVQSYVYATKTVQEFEKAGIILISIKGKKRIIKLTEKGEKIARSINEILQNAPAGI